MKWLVVAMILWINAVSAVSDVVQKIPEAGSIKCNNLVGELKQQGKKIITLSYGEALFDIPNLNSQELPYPAVHHYSHARGILPLREAIADHYSDIYGFTFDPAQEIIVTHGSKAAIYLAMLSVLNPGDEVLIHEPAWVSFSAQATLCHANMVFIPYWEDEFAYEKYITPKTKMVIVNNPRNPNGILLTREEMTYLLDLAQKHNFYILSDEVHSDFIQPHQEFISFGELDPDKKHIIVCDSISKNFSISGWRVGYVITNANLIDQILKANQHIITCIASPIAYALAKNFKKLYQITGPQVARVMQKRLAVAKYMDEIGIEYFPGDATFHFFISIRKSQLSSSDFSQRLLEEHYVSTIPGSGYGPHCSSFIRVSIGAASLDDIKIGLQAIKQLLEETA